MKEAPFFKSRIKEKTRTLTKDVGLLKCVRQESSERKITLKSCIICVVLKGMVINEQLSNLRNELRLRLLS